MELKRLLTADYETLNAFIYNHRIESADDFNFYSTPFAEKTQFYSGKCGKLE